MSNKINWNNPYAAECFRLIEDLRTSLIEKDLKLEEFLHKLTREVKK